MKSPLLAWIAAASCLFLVSTALAAPPNWKVSGTGTTEGPGDGSVPEIDDFAGTASHLGRYTGEGSHLLNPTTGQFTGEATYTAANGDLLFVEYAGGIVNIDPTSEFPFEFVAEVQIVGGTGRLAKATGSGAMVGAFSGVPGDFFFNIEGTLRPQGKR